MSKNKPAVLEKVNILNVIGKNQPNSTFEFKGTPEEARKMFPNDCIIEGCNRKASDDCPECYCFKHCCERCMNAKRK